MTKKQLGTLCSDYLFFFAIFFRINKKIPRGPPSPPAPVMHSPSRKVILMIFFFFNFIKSPSAYGYISPWWLNFVLQDQIWTQLGLQNSVLMKVFVNTCCTASHLASALSGQDLPSMQKYGISFESSCIVPPLRVRHFEVWKNTAQHFSDLKSPSFTLAFRVARVHYTEQCALLPEALLRCLFMCRGL